MKLALAKGSTNVTVNVFVQDSSSTTGGGLTGLVYNSSGLTCYYVRPLAAAAALSLVTQTVTGAHSAGGFVEIDATNMPGWYRLDLSDAICAAGVDHVGLLLKGATNMAPLPLEIQLTDIDLNDGVRGGMTALPNAAAEAAGGLYTRGTGAGQINQPANGQIDGNVVALGGVAQSLTDLKDFADAGYDPATNKVQGVVLVDTVTTLTGHTPQTGDNYARIGAPAGASVSADIATAQADLDILTGTDGATLATSQPNYAPAKAGDSMALTAGGVDAIWDEATSGHVTAGTMGKALTDVLADTAEIGTAGIGLSNLGGMSATMKAQVNAEVDSALDTAIPGTPTANSINERIAAIDDLTQSGGSGDLAAVLADTADMQPKLGTPAADVSADIAAVKTETASILADTNELQTDDVPGLIAALNDISAADILTTALTEAYASDGVSPTLSQLLFGIQAFLQERTVAGTTMTVKKLDGSTTAMTFTINDAGSPTSITRAT